MKSTKKLLFITSLLSLAFTLEGLAQDTKSEQTGKISTELLDTAPKVKYTEDNSSVRWKDFNTGKQIRDIGRRLGAEIKFQAEENLASYPYASGQPDYKYKASRVFPDTKLGADVLFISKKAKTGTFKNLTRIVSGYIERAYGIPMESADSIAQKVCWWNTAHYQDYDYFSNTFESRVVQVFSNNTNKIGLSQNYKNWPGQARIVIPFAMIKAQAPQAETPEEKVAPEEIPEDLKEEAVIPQEEITSETPEAEEPEAEEAPAIQEEKAPQETSGQVEEVNIETSKIPSGILLPLVAILSILLVIAIIIIIVLASKYKKASSEK